MRLKVMPLYVTDQDKALAFYTDTLGFRKKTDVGNGPYRWLTVVSAEDPDGVELQLAPDGSPVARAYREGLHAEGTPAVMLFVSDIEAEAQRLASSGVTLTMPVTKVPGSKIARLDDGCGNVVQLTQLEWS